jgi:hypothetical protein
MTKILFFICAVMVSVAFAQDLACESLFANYPKPTVELTSLEQTINSTSTVNGQTADATISQVIDYTNRRIYQDMTMQGNNIVMRYSDGKGSMAMKMGEETMDMDMPPESVTALEAIFDQGIAQGLPENYTVVSCDGQQAYAGLLEGEQVTVSSTVPTMGEVASKIIFGAEGKVNGSISEIPGQGEVLMVFENMVVDDANIPTSMTMSMYQLQGDNATPLSTTTMEVKSYNQPIDETLFAE